MKKAFFMIDALPEKVIRRDESIKLHSLTAIGTLAFYTIIVLLIIMFTKQNFLTGKYLN